MHLREAEPVALQQDALFVLRVRPCSQQWFHPTAYPYKQLHTPSCSTRRTEDLQHGRVDSADEDAWSITIPIPLIAVWIAIFWKVPNFWTPRIPCNAEAVRQWCCARHCEWRPRRHLEHHKVNGYAPCTALRVALLPAFQPACTGFRLALALTRDVPQADRVFLALPLSFHVMHTSACAYWTHAEGLR